MTKFRQILRRFSSLKFELSAVNTCIQLSKNIFFDYGNKMFQPFAISNIRPYKSKKRQASIVNILRNKTSINQAPSNLALDLHPWLAKISIATTSKNRHITRISCWGCSFCNNFLNLSQYVALKRTYIIDGFGLKVKTTSLRQSQIDQNILPPLQLEVFFYVLFPC